MLPNPSRKFQIFSAASCQVTLLMLFLSSTGVSTLESPDVLVVLLASNEEHTLPTFFGCFEQLEYPRKAMGELKPVSMPHDLLFDSMSVGGDRMGI